MTSHRFTVLLLASATGSAVAVAWVVHPGWRPELGLPTPAYVAMAWVQFAVAVVAVRRLPVRTAVPLILASGAALLAIAVSAPPSSSDDLYRYQWDGRVQAAGTDPYAYSPADPALAGLRDPFLWPETSNWCVTAGQTGDAGQPLVPGCTLINRPAVHTIYPPVAQAYFVAVHAAPGDGTTPVQWAAAGVALATTVLLLLGLRRAGRDPRLAALWAWCPTVVLEAGNNAHVDVLGAALAVAALLVLANARNRVSRHVGGGLLLGLAIATKLTPGLLIPAMIRRRPVAVMAAVVSTVVAVYLPHIVAVGADVFGYIPGYLNEEGYANGDRFALLTLVLPHTWATPVAVLVLAAIALRVLRVADPDRPWHAGTVMVAGALLVATPAYSWYALLLVALAALDGRARWLAVALAGHFALYARDLHIDPTLAARIGYAAALAVLAGLWYRQRTAQLNPPEHLAPSRSHADTEQ